MAQELKMTVIRGREQRDKLLLEVDRLKQVSTTVHGQLPQCCEAGLFLTGSGSGFFSPAPAPALIKKVKVVFQP